MTRARRRMRARSHGMTLIETVIIVVVLAIAVPPSMIWIEAATSRRRDAVNIIRANSMAVLILEQILSDASTTDIGAVATYQSAPGTGLTARLTTPLSLYTNLGLSYSVSIDAAASDYTGTVTSDVDEDLFRGVTVTVTYPKAAGGSQNLVMYTKIAKP